MKPKPEMCELRRDFSSLLNTFLASAHLSKKLTYRKYAEKYSNGNKTSEKNMAELIAQLYERVRKSKSSCSEKRRIKTGEFVPEDYLKRDADYLKPLVLMNGYIKKEMGNFGNFYLQGSFSTMDYVKHWSDVDLTGILKSETVQDPEKLTELKNRNRRVVSYMLAVDPLQHHEVSYMTEYDITHYFDGLLPPAVFEHSKAMNGPKEITFMVEKSRDMVVPAIETFSRYFRKRSMDNDDVKDLFDLKYVLSVILLLPSLYMQAKGRPCYKKCSFRAACKDFGNEWKIVELASNIREKWNYSRPAPFWVLALFKEHPFLVKSIGRIKNRGIPGDLRNEIGHVNLFKDAYIFCKKILGNLETARK